MQLQIPESFFHFGLLSGELLEGEQAVVVTVLLGEQRLHVLPGSKREIAAVGVLERGEHNPGDLRQLVR